VNFVFHWCFIVPFPLLYIMCFTGVVLYPSLYFIFCVSLVLFSTIPSNKVEGTIQNNTSEAQNTKLRERYKTIPVKHKILSWGNDTKQHQWNNCTLPSTLYFVFHWCRIVPFPLLYILCFTGVLLYPSLYFIFCVSLVFYCTLPSKHQWNTKH
jgi:Ca2+/Na+ antiporter